ncbi:MAG: DoxX family protein [Actinomycetota bacterium]|jgi:uncharacterized membrane protein|nr:DoxX family protein [Actinomycetota bacterium]
MWGLVSLFATSGVMHFVRPGRFAQIVPRGLPHRRALVHVSGAAELACAAGLVCPATRRLSGLASAAVLVAVFPANLQMTVDIFRRRSTAARLVAVARLPLQLPMIRVGWRVWKQA